MSPVKRRRKYMNTPTDMAIKTILVFLMSVLSFAVGTYVGRQFSDAHKKIEEHQRVILEQKTTQQTVHDEIQQITKGLEKVNER